MTIFEIIKLVLDDEFDSIPGTKQQKIDAVDAELTALQDKYGKLTSANAVAPSYSSPATRFAYIYKYTTCHANIVADKLASVTELGAMFRGTARWLDVACIGGGPGSDFLGVVKAMIRDARQVNLKTFLLDKEPAWGDSWSGVERQADGLEFRISTHSQSLDVTDRETWSTERRYLSAELFTFVYFISEIWRLRNSAGPFFEHLMKRARPGSFFLFIDNRDSRFYDYFDAVATAAGLAKLGGSEEDFQMEYAEEKTDLEPYFSMFSHQPKIKSAIAWRVYQKPSEQPPT